MATDMKIKQCLKKFGFEQFRSESQEKAIRAIINGLFLWLCMNIDEFFV